MNFADQVKYVRIKLHLSQVDFAKLMGVNFTTVNRWENGKTEPSYKALPNFEIICKEHQITF